MPMPTEPIVPSSAIARAADKAMRELVELFSSARVRSHAHFRRCTDAPTEFDLWFESIVDEIYGADPNNEYRQWIERLRQNGLIP